MSQTNVTLTFPEGRWNLISFLNVSSSILACSTTKKNVDHDDLDKVATHLADVVADGHLPDLVAVLVKERVHCDRGSVLCWGAYLGKHDLIYLKIWDNYFPMIYGNGISLSCRSGYLSELFTLASRSR